MMDITLLSRMEKSIYLGHKLEEFSLPLNLRGFAKNIIDIIVNIHFNINIVIVINKY